MFCSELRKRGQPMDDSAQRSMTDEARRRLVLDRLKLAKRVFEQNEALRACDDLFTDRDGGWTHAYADHDAIVTYLLLTCFDILGPKDVWLSFDDWLVAERTAQRRNAVAQQVANLASAEAAKILHRAYLDDFGTTQGFFRFIDEVLSVDARTALLYSIRTWHQGTEVDVEDALPKKRFLFALRNAFTHAGLTHGSHARAMMPTLIDIADRRIRWGWEPIRNDGKYSYGVRRWPFVLFETIYSVLNEPVDDDYDIAINVVIEPQGGSKQFFKNLRYASLRDIAALEAAAKEP